MLVQPIKESPQSAHVVVLGNEKGGSGKSTTALHIAVALLKAGQRVATIDLDSRQKSFTHYIENRRDWAVRARIKLEHPTHYCVERGEGNSVEGNEAIEFANFSKAISAIEHTHDVVVVDTPTHMQIDRLVRQRGMTQDQAEARMGAQASREQRLAIADLVVDNSSSLAELDRQVGDLWTELRRRARLQPSR